MKVDMKIGEIEANLEDLGFEIWETSCFGEGGFESVATANWIGGGGCCAC